MHTPERFAADLLNWFDERRISLPWRDSADPYAIWVSEIMLQQTQVATVIPYFERWMRRFPSVAALASAPHDLVMKAWEGLGYYSRARHLHAAARMVVEHHGGRVPDNWAEIRRLPGVGDYTAGAVLSMAFGQAVPAVDGNALRVFSRLALIREDVSKPTGKRLIAAALGAVIAQTPRPGDLNQAVMDLGREVCVPANPRCDACPVRAHCRAEAAGETSSLPVKPGTKAPREMVLAAALVQRDGRSLLVKRPTVGIWGGLWALPTVELARLPVPSAETCQSEAARAWGLAGWPVRPGPLLTLVQHQLTHRSLFIPVFEAELLADAPPAAEHAWLGPEEWGEVPMPVPFVRLFQRLDVGPLFRHGSLAAAPTPVRLL
jgi:A/G-specific adenine glycosylase